MNLPIGIFDSGAGGLTVLREIAKRFPGESIVYFGDTARLPYGDKSQDTISRYTHQCVNYLVTFPVKIVVIACNTASAYAIHSLKDKFNIPVIDVVAPSAQKACKTTVNGRIGVLGTAATIRSGCYQRAIHAMLPQANVFPIASPLFVPLVEENLIAHPATELLVKEYLKPLQLEKIDTLILGCTHYPVLKELISKTLGDSIQIIDSATCCADTISLTSQNKTETPNYQFFVSDDIERFQRLATAFLPSNLLPLKVNLIAMD